jgi:integrase
VSKGANGRSSIHRRRNGEGWEGWVSFGVDPTTGARVRKHVRGRTKTEVADKIKRLESDRDGGYSAASRDLTLLEWLDEWIGGQRASVRPKTLAGYKVDRSYVEAFGIGKIKLTKLTPEDIERLYERVLARPTCSAGTVAHLRRTLSAALNTAVGRGRLARNPVKAARTPTHQTEEVEPFTVSEAKRILAAAKHRRNGASWSMRLALGLRQGEILGLQWSDVDLDEGTVRIRRQLQRLTWEHGCGRPSECTHPRTGKLNRGADCPQRHGGGLVVAEPKSKAGRRIIALPAPLASDLREHYEAQADERVAAGSLWRGGGWLFASEVGGPTDPRQDHRAWVDLLARAGVRAARLHDARHTAATLLLVMGVDSRTVMALMGWSSFALVQRYQHVVDELRREAAVRMGRTLWES